MKSAVSFRWILVRPETGFGKYTDSGEVHENEKHISISN